MLSVLKFIFVFLFVCVIGITNCFSQSDTSAYKMKKVYFGVEVSPVVSFKGKFSGNEKFSTDLYSGEVVYTTSYNSKNNILRPGLKIAMKTNLRLRKDFRLNVQLQYSVMGYQPRTVDTTNVITYTYNLWSPTKSQFVNSTRYKFSFQFASLPILVGHERKLRTKSLCHIYLGVEPSFLITYVIDARNELSTYHTRRTEYETFRALRDVKDKWTGEQFDDSYFLFYHARVGMNYFISKKRFLSFDAAYSVSSPRTGLKSQLHNVGLVIGYNF